ARGGSGGGRRSRKVAPREHRAKNRARGIGLSELPGSETNREAWNAGDDRLDERRIRLRRAVLAQQPFEHRGLGLVRRCAKAARAETAKPLVESQAVDHDGV